MPFKVKCKGHVVPDSFTHGSSEQRMKWFMKGFKSGDIRLGDTFAERTLIVLKLKHESDYLYIQDSQIPNAGKVCLQN